MPILPSPERQEEFLEEGIKTPPSTPTHSPHAFLKEDRWLFSPPPVLTPENTNLDKSETKTDTTPHDTDKDQNSKMLKKRVVRPSSLILPSEGKSPRKRSRTNTVAALLDYTSAKRPDTPITTDNTHSGAHPILLVRPVRLPVGTDPATWNPPSLCYIVGLGLNCKFIDLLFKRSVIKFTKISSFVVSLFQKLFTVRQTHSQKN